MVYAAILALSSTLTPALALEEFNQHCAVLDGYQEITDRARVAGWVQFMPESGSPIGQNLRILGSRRSATGRRVEFDYSVFSSTRHEGAALLITRWRHGDDVSLDCQFYASNAERQATHEELVQWIERTAETIDNDEASQASWWEPGWHASHTKTGVVFVSQAAAEAFPFLMPGLTITGRSETN